MSYVIDVYRESKTPTRDFVAYALFVSFFPQLLAGPIERASQLLEQILQPRKITFQMVQDGTFFVFWGLFLKVFVADNLAKVVDPIFSVRSSQTGFSYLIAGYAYTFQIYADFAGYSNMAKGFGNILGFEMIDNFHLPYFSQNPREFWRRWHISLSTWFRDYVYIPLGGNRSGDGRTAINLMITMFLCGLWHGAKITFVIWGGLHGILLCIHHFVSHSLAIEFNSSKRIHASIRLLRILLFFHVIVISWYFFRVQSLNQLHDIGLALSSGFCFDLAAHKVIIKQLLFYAMPLVIVEFLQFYRKDIVPILQLPIVFRTLLYVIIFYLVIIFGATDAQNFIYLQF